MPKCSRNQMSPLVRTNRCLPWRQLDSKQPPFQSARKLTRGDAFQNMSARHIDFVDALMQRRGVQIPLERFNIRQLWHWRLPEFLDVFLQRHGVVVLTVLRAKEQGDRPLSGFMRELLDLLALILQLRRVSFFNSLHRAGSCSNHSRNRVLGAISFSQSSICASFFFSPRGQMRSTNTRCPSVLAGLS